MKRSFGSGNSDGNSSESEEDLLSPQEQAVGKKRREALKRSVDSRYTVTEERLAL